MPLRFGYQKSYTKVGTLQTKTLVRLEEFVLPSQGARLSLSVNTTSRGRLLVGETQEYCTTLSSIECT